MKKLILASLFFCALFVTACAPKYALNHSTPAHPISLPEDGAAHYWAQTEWWYYTGHLTAEDGRDFGYEITFFKRITNEDNVPHVFIPVPAHWLKDVAMLGHFAVSGLTGKKFASTEIDNSFNKSRADEDKYYLQIDKWKAYEENGKHMLYAEMKDYQLSLELEPAKPAALHGHNGIVNKGGSNANYYYSFTNMKTSGTLTLDGKPVKVAGKSWMDHEYGTMRLTPPQSGWDWFSVQLDNDCELMLYLIRSDTDEKIHCAGGTFVLPNGRTIWITADDFSVKTLDYWYSKKTDSSYPVAWEIIVNSLNLKLNINPVFAEQELILKPLPYWEGNVLISGTYNNLPVQGKGYVELVGYSKKYPLVYF